MHQWADLIPFCDSFYEFLSNERELRFIIILLTQVETVQDELLRLSGPYGIWLRVFLILILQNSESTGTQLIHRLFLEKKIKKDNIYLSLSLPSLSYRLP